MATANISFNPAITTNFPGSFFVSSDGYVQGDMMDDPAARYALQQGIVADTETVPMWGGIGITADIPNPTSVSDGIGAVLSRATAQTNLAGFTVFTQGSAMITTPQSPVPLAGSYGSINFFEFGSGARIVVQADPTLVTALEGGSVLTQVSWDYTNQKLIAYDSVAALPVKIVGVNAGNSKIVTYNGTTGFATWTETGSTVVIKL